MTANIELPVPDLLALNTPWLHLKAPPCENGKSTSLASIKPLANLTGDSAGELLVANPKKPTETISFRFGPKMKEDPRTRESGFLIQLGDKTFNAYDFEVISDPESGRSYLQLAFGVDEKGRFVIDRENQLQEQGINAYGAFVYKRDEDGNINFYLEHRRKSAEPGLINPDGIKYCLLDKDTRRARDNILTAVERWKDQSKAISREMLIKLKPEYALAAVFTALSAGLALPEIGQLLGHINIATPQAVQWGEFLRTPADTIRILSTALSAGAASITLLSAREQLKEAQTIVTDRVGRFFQRPEIARYLAKKHKGKAAEEDKLIPEKLLEKREQILAGFEVVDREYVREDGQVKESVEYPLKIGGNPVVIVPDSNHNVSMAYITEKTNGAITLAFHISGQQRIYQEVTPENSEIINGVSIIFIGTGPDGFPVFGARYQLAETDITPELSLTYRSSMDQAPSDKDDILVVNHIDNSDAAGIFSEGIRCQQMTNEELSSLLNLQENIDELQNAQAESLRARQALMALGVPAAIALSLGIGLPSLLETVSLQHPTLALPGITGEGFQLSPTNDYALYINIVKNRLLDQLKDADILTAVLGQVAALTSSSALLIKTYVDREVGKRVKALLNR